MNVPCRRPTLACRYDKRAFTKTLSNILPPSIGIEEDGRIPKANRSPNKSATRNLRLGMTSWVVMFPCLNDDENRFS